MATDNAFLKPGWRARMESAIADVLMNSVHYTGNSNDAANDANEARDKFEQEEEANHDADSDLDSDGDNKV